MVKQTVCNGGSHSVIHYNNYDYEFSLKPIKTACLTNYSTISYYLHGNKLTNENGFNDSELTTYTFRTHQIGF